MPSQELPSWDERTSSEEVGALYLHVPFCVRKCAYCDFASWATREGDEILHRYAQSLGVELSVWQKAGLLHGLRTAYIGGGTPSMLGKDLAGLAARIAALGVQELTAEANPESVTAELLGTLKEAGLTRISIGVQSTDDHELRLLGRIHTAKQALWALREACAAGLDVSADLMCALPDETDESWGRSLADVVAAGVGHISVYPLMIEEGTAFAKRYGRVAEPAWNDSDVQARRMVAAERMLSAQGFSRYEVASYAKPGRACLHNQAYWSGLSYLGLGTGASGMLSRPAYERARSVLPQLPELAPDAYRIRIANAVSRKDYAAAGPQDLHFTLELLTRRQALAEDLMLAARMSRPLDPSLVAAALAEPSMGAGAALAKAQDEGLLDGRLAVTEKGWLLGNELFGLFWDCAGDAPTKVQKV